MRSAVTASGSRGGVVDNSCCGCLPAGAIGGARVGKPTPCRYFRMAPGSVRAATTFTVPPQRSHTLTAAFPLHLGHSVGRLSRGKTRDLPPTYPPHLQPSVRVAIGLQRSVPPRPPPAASYAVRVPRAGSPPTAAFPLHPCHAVAVRLGVPTTRVFGGISTPLVTSRSAFASRLSDVLTDVARRD